MSLSNDILETLILEGAVEIAGMSEKGEMLYSFTPKLQEISPELYKEISSLFYAGVMNLWQKGFIDVDLTLEEPLVTLNQEALTAESIDALSAHEKNLLDNIIRQFENDK